MGPAVEAYVTAFLARPTTYWYMRLRRLYRFSCDYPPDVFASTLVAALERRAFEYLEFRAMPARGLARSQGLPMGGPGPIERPTGRDGIRPPLP